MIINNYTKENNGLKEDIINLTNKVNQIEQKFNSLENKIDILLNYVSDKKEKEKEEKNEKEKENLFLFENSLGKSKIIENNEQILLLKNWLPYQNKNKLKCRLIYDGKRDGDKASTFHSLCDNKESTLTLVSTSDNRKIGGFLSKPFGGNKGFIIDNNAFLFNLNYNEKYPSLNKGNHYKDLKDQGPIFGNICISIKDNFLSNDDNYYHPYTARYDFGSRNDNTDYYFKVIDLEVYQIFE